MEERLVAADISRYKLVRNNWFAYNPMRLNIGSIARWQGNSDVLVSPDYVVFRCLERSTPPVLHPGYLDHFRKSRQWDAFVNEAGDGGVRVRIYYRDISQLRLILPDVAEQQQVADCLGTLDDLIAAEGRKIEALRRHKHGLMEQLFPQPGETVPRLRFPEFRDSGKWEEKRLGDLGTLISGLTYSPTDVQDGGLLVLRSSNIQNGEITLDDRVYVRRDVNGANLTRPDDILICVRNGSKSLIGKNAIVPKGMPACTHGAFMTVFRASAPRFARVLLQTTAYQKQVAADLGATINSINGSQLLKYRFTVPKPAEQLRIAACLFSLDEMLAAQWRKLDRLKVHKRGLLQQLFPSPEGNE
ncbi:restriction endonuclease subunit S [Bradyrhizobium sp. dw_78]|uniref:restriction endonuclease subunit S n=1 Tax=Bradyrhizobium sp. dw_78 TaxID=2719793 RepID=UPI001BD4398F|nr:restriction endonuclease subunit S [Bradyrhizobium sp. dw_78]